VFTLSPATAVALAAVVVLAFIAMPPGLAALNGR
jgi:hypothetical protein